MNKKCICGILSVLASLVVPEAAADLTLMKNGKAETGIVLEEKAGPVERHAARELSAYLGKIAGGEAPRIGTRPVPGTIPLYLKITEDQELHPEGFRIKTDQNSVTVSARQGIGVLYGVYEILKKYGGVRWLTPGKDGEYFTLKKEITVPEENIVRNPSSDIRTFFFGCANVTSPQWETYDWMVRNNMRIENFKWILDNPALKEKLAERAAVIRDGTHVFTSLLAGTRVRSVTYADSMKKIDLLYQSDPDIFPLINGKRVKLGDHRFQPCTSNPKTLKIMAENLDLWAKLIGREGYYVVGNDDGTGWCQCENCVKLDPPEERKLGFLSTRYWTFTNALIQKVRTKHPDAQLWGWAYQNFQQPPAGTKVDPKTHVMQVYNRRCYRHDLTDPNCPTNRVFLDYFNAWSKLGNPTSTWEQIDASAIHYLPIEKIFGNSLKTYHKLHVSGAMPVVGPWDGTYGPAYKDSLYPQSWRMMWQTLYLASQLLWDVNRDMDAMLEEASSLYYGNAWENGMKEFRELLTKASSATPGCFGWGHDGSPLGRCLDQPGVHETLLELLKKAETSVRNDPRALAHVKKDRELFAATWEKERRNYLENYRELKAFKRQNPIAIDGELKETDWKNADIVSNFKRTDKGTAKQQTYVRVVYEPKFLYLAVEAMEPNPEKMLSHVKNGAVWEDNALEVFLNHPDWDSAYAHLVFNAKGNRYEALNRPGQKSADTTFRSHAELKIKVQKDRWTAELKIPTSSLGMKCFDNTTWKINIGRARLLNDGTKEYSSLANGAFHGAGSFLPLSFSGSRTGGAFGERDSRTWRNGALNETVPAVPEKNPNWNFGTENKLPKFWHLNSKDGILEMIRRPESSPADYYLKWSKGVFFQIHTGTDLKYKIRFEAAGKGSFFLAAYRYSNSSPSRFLGTDAIGNFQADSPEWKTLECVYEKKNADEKIGFAFHHKNGEILLDNVSVYPQE